MKKILNIFRIYPGERRETLTALVFFTILNVLNLVKHWSALTAVSGNKWTLFTKGWHLSGFDPITYSVVTDWGIGYNIYRHPLLAYFLWPLSKLNEALIWLTGYNCAIMLVAILLIACATYAALFINRIHRRVIGLERTEGAVLTLLTYSFAHVMLASMAPDHFIMSMFCLTLTLYLCGMKLKRGSAMNMWQTIVMFILTAGVSLNNGLKIFLAAMVTRRKRFFEWRYLLFAVILPSALIWGSARWSYKQFVWPKEMARKEKTAKAFEKRIERNFNNIWNAEEAKWNKNDSVKIKARQKELRDSIRHELMAKKARRWRASAAYKHSGKPMADGEFSKWTDITTSRWDVAVESLFGEGIMLHEDYLLGDVLVNRPVIVRYHNWGNYIVEGLLVILFLAGIWYGRRQLFLWTAMSFFIMDMLLHMGLGFGINELPIMSAHYLFVLPIAMAYLLKALTPRWRKRLTWATGAVALYITVWNISLLVEYLFIL